MIARTVGTSSPLEVPEGAEFSAEYSNGRNAFMEGMNDVASCPYPRGDRRTKWMSGYWAEWVRQFLIRWEAKHLRTGEEQ